MGWFKIFLDIQDHLGQAQGHRQPGVGLEQGRHQGLVLGNVLNTKVVQIVRLSCFWMLPAIQEHLEVKSRTKDIQG